MATPPTLERFRVVALSAATCFACALLGIAGCSDASSPERAPAQTRQAIAGGTVDTAHQNVFLLAAHRDQFGSLCTATLIAPNLLLTARHCVSPSNGDDHVTCGEAVLGEPYPPSAFITTNDAQPRDGSTVFRAAEVRVPAQGMDTCGYDIALVILKENVPANVSVPAVPRIDRDVTPGEVYTAVGYGLNENGRQNAGRMQLSGLVVDCEPGSCGEGVESTEFRGDTGICSGDSGGPALDADGKVVGVVSRGGPDCSTPVYGSVTAWRDFLIDTASEAATLGGYEPAFWVTTRASDPPAVVDPSASGGAAGEAGGAEGDSCRSGAECGSGMVCYATAHDESGTCVRTCQTTADCGSGQFCDSQGDVAVCTVPQHSADESGCAVAPKPAGGTTPVSLLGLIVGALTLLRRRLRR